MLYLWILNYNSSLPKAHNAILPGDKRKPLDNKTSKGLFSSEILWFAISFLATLWKNQLILEKKEIRTVFSHLKRCHMNGRLDVLSAASKTWTGPVWEHYKENAAYIRQNFPAAIRHGVEVCAEVMTPLPRGLWKPTFDKPLSELLYWAGMGLSGLRLGVGIKWDNMLEYSQHHNWYK